MPSLITSWKLPFDYDSSYRCRAGGSDPVLPLAQLDSGRSMNDRKHALNVELCGARHHAP